MSPLATAFYRGRGLLYQQLGSKGREREREREIMEEVESDGFNL